MPLNFKEKRAGVIVPLFSLRTRNSPFIGEIPDLAQAGEWFASMGQTVIQVLPIFDMGDFETSPYSAVSAFAIDPVYLSFSGLPELGEDEVGKAFSDAGLSAGNCERVDYKAVRVAKKSLLASVAERFKKNELVHLTQKGRRFKEFCVSQQQWLDPYCLYSALKESNNHAGWEDWSEGQKHGPLCIDSSLVEQMENRIFVHRFGQWLAHEQWLSARAELSRQGIFLMGDLPFTVSRDSADVWAHQDLFDLEVESGAPPDQYSNTGQNWGLPGYNWNKMQQDDYSWFRARAARASDLFDLFRVDHVVGMFRTWTIPRLNGKPHFRPSNKKSQEEQGKAVLLAMRDASKGGAIVAEDLGVIPDFVRECMAGLEIPGYKVLRWERDGDAFKDPARYPVLSIAASGNHDTEPLAIWWEMLSENEKRLFFNLPLLKGRSDSAGLGFCRKVHESILEVLYKSGSCLAIMPIQDLLAVPDRINVPGTSSRENWTWRLPGTIEDLVSMGAALSENGVDRETLKRMVQESGRL
ncbi:MAG: 4-alpha-glucanotransferase [Deltaproteobacteria bacterium]|nr:4-alpha-glucanotransferase [Deltaproteobacteria bacterium]